MGKLPGNDTPFTSDLADMKDLFDTYMSYTRCKGGRLVHSGYCCTHCGSDRPKQECYAPKPERKEECAI